MLTEKQREQIEKQIEFNSHERHKVDVVLSPDKSLRNLAVYKNVLNPVNVAAVHLARWLYYNNGLYRGKVAIDMGSGTGIQGVVMGMRGAEKVISSDISDDAVSNTQDNVSRFGLEQKVSVVQGDLFENIDTKADLIVFNLPFFPAEPYKEHPVTLAMLDEGGLIQRFLDEAHGYLRKEGKLIMPFFGMGGEINDPLVQAPAHGYRVEERFFVDTTGYALQEGEIYIYELSQIE